MAKLGVNIDHVATVRQARRTYEPDPVWAAMMAEIGGADGITIHLREDRRHIQDRDLRLLKETVSVKLNLELAANDAVVDIACQIKPQQVTLVPENREEVTTEGGLDAHGQQARLHDIIRRLKDAGMEVSLFLDTDPRQIETAKALAADAVELHTGRYSEAHFEGNQTLELESLISASHLVCRLGLTLHAGHGLNYRNVLPVAAIPGMCELNIGHALVSRAIFTGLEKAVREMKDLVSRHEKHPHAK